MLMNYFVVTLKRVNCKLLMQFDGSIRFGTSLRFLHIV